MENMDTKDKVDKTDKYLMTSVNKTLEILDLLSKHKDGLRAINISRALNINKTSTFKMLYTLEKNRYVHKTTSGRYELGIKFVQYASSLLEKNNLVDIVKPFLKELRDKYNETTHLGIIDNDLNVTFMAKEMSTASLQMISNVGVKTPFHGTAMGKVIVAYNFNEEMKEKIRGYRLDKFTDNTITAYEELFKRLQKIKEQGYGEDLEENEVGLVCYAAPVMNFTGETIAAISISGPAFRMKSNKENLIISIIETSKRVSAAMGYEE